MSLTCANARIISYFEMRSRDKALNFFQVLSMIVLSIPPPSRTMGAKGRQQTATVVGQAG